MDDTYDFSQRNTNALPSIVDVTDDNNSTFFNDSKKINLL